MALILVLFLCVVGYLVGLAVYRLYLSPLARIPGPKLAALSGWYEGYYDIVLRGKYTFRIEEMHEQYGPIVQVTPDEVHIKDSMFWDEVFVRRPKGRKSAVFKSRFSNDGSMFAVQGAEHHRMLRAPLNPFFSRKAILDQEAQVQKKAEVVCRGFEQLRSRDAVFRVTDPFAAFACDVVYDYAFGFTYGQIEQDGFKPNFHDPFIALTEIGHVAVQFPWINQVVENYIPEKYLPEDAQKAMQLRKDFEKTIFNVRQQAKGSTSRSIFQAILDSDLPASEKTDRRLTHEAQAVIAGGIITTAWAFTNATFYLLSDPTVLEKLRTELRQAIPDISASNAFDYEKLERLPYLTGVVKEGLRVSYGVSGRLGRVFDEPLIYKDWTIPPDTVVSLSIGDVSFDESIFENAKQFKPERWAPGASKLSDGSTLENYFVIFSKGPRMCLGMSLAYMELYILLAHIFRRFELQLYETDASDVELAHDFFIPAARMDSKGVRIQVVGTLD